MFFGLSGSMITSLNASMISSSSLIESCVYFLRYTAVAGSPPSSSMLERSISIAFASARSFSASSISFFASSTAFSARSLSAFANSACFVRLATFFSAVSTAFSSAAFSSSLFFLLSSAAFWASATRSSFLFSRALILDSCSALSLFS